MSAQEHDAAASRERELLREIDLLKERLDASQRAWNATRTELEERAARFSRNDAQVREYETSCRTLEQTQRAFKEQLASMLTDSYVTVEPYEEQIRERVTQLVRASSDKTAVSAHACPDAASFNITATYCYPVYCKVSFRRKVQSALIFVTED